MMEKKDESADKLTETLELDFFLCFVLGLSQYQIMTTQLSWPKKKISR